MLMDSELEGARLDARRGHAQPEGAKQALCAVRTETSARRASRAQKRVAQRPEIAVRELAGRHRVAAHESPPLVDAACALGHASPHVLSQCTSTRQLTCETTEQCTFHSTRVLSTLPQPETRMMVQDRTKTSVLGAAAAALLPARARSEARATNPRGLHEQPARAQLVRTQVRAAATPPRLRRRLNAPGCCLPAAKASGRRCSSMPSSRRTRRRCRCPTRRRARARRSTCVARGQRRVLELRVHALSRAE